MARIETWFEQDLKKPVIVHKLDSVFSQDAKGNLIGVKVFSDGVAVALTDSITGYCVLADGSTVPVSGNRSGNQASIVLPASAYNVLGPIMITVKNTGSDYATTLCAVAGLVVRSRTGNQVSPGSVVTDWTNQISAQLQAVQTAADNLGSVLAVPFSNLTAYSAGNYVMKDGNLYCFTTDHAAGDWNSSQVRSAKLADDVRSLKSALNERINANADRSNWIEKNGNFVFVPQFVQGRYNSGAVTRNDNTTKYVRTDWIAVDSDTDLVTYIDSSLYGNIKVWLTEADKNGNYVRQTGNRDTGSTFSMTGVRYIGINATIPGEATDIVPSDVYGKIYVSQKVIDDDILVDVSTNRKLIVAENMRDNLIFTNAKYDVYPEFIQGRYNSGSVIINPNVSNYIRTNPIAIDPSIPLTIYNADSSFNYVPILLDKNGNYITEKGNRGYSYTYQPSELNSTARYVALNVYKSTAITPADFVGKLHIYQATIEEQIPKNVAQIKDRLTTDILKENHGGSFFKTLEFESGRFESGTGLPIDNASWVRTKEPILVNPKLPYIVSRTHSTNVNVYQYDADYKYIREDTIYGNATGYGAFRTLNPACYYVNIGIPSTSGDATIFEQRFSVDSDINIQDYFVTQLETKVPTIVQNMNDAGKNGTTFVFITDPHWDSNYKSSPSLIRYVLKHANIHNVFCGGDVINEGEKADMYAYFIDCVKHFQLPLSNMFFPIARGNHDDNSNWSSTEEVTAHEFDSNTMYNLFMNNMSGKVTPFGDRWNFYFDEESIKTRYYFLDTARDGTQINYNDVIAQLKLLPENWHAIFVLHIVFYNTTNLAQGANELAHIVGAYNARTSGSYIGIEYDFTTGAVGTVDLIIGGHAHRDLAFEADNENNASGIPIIVTDTDSWRDHLNTGATINAQCFDVVTVDYTNKTVKCVRIGRGSDRTFSYGT